MKTPMVGLLIIIVIGQACASQQHTNPLTTAGSDAQRNEVLRISREKWRWMAERKVDSLAALFDDRAVFVHMGATMNKTQRSTSSDRGSSNTKTQIYKRSPCGL